MGLLPCLPVLHTPVSLPSSTPCPSASPAPRSTAGLEAPLSKNDYSLGFTVKLLFTLGSPCPYSCPGLVKPVLKAELRWGVENERRWLVSCGCSNKRTANWGADNKRNPFSLSSRGQKSQSQGQAGPFPSAVRQNLIHASLRAPGGHQQSVACSCITLVSAPSSGALSSLCLCLLFHGCQSGWIWACPPPE